MRKIAHYFVILLVMVGLSSCNQFRSNHPQSEIGGQYATALDPIAIINYSDSVDNNLSNFQKETSLVYMLGDQSFYVDRYTENNKPTLLIEYSSNGLLSSVKKQFYFKNDSLVLEKISSKVSVEEGAVFKEIRSYLRNNIVFKNEERIASTKLGLSSQSFVDIELSKLNGSDKTHGSNITTLNQVVDGTDKFKMIFQNITTYPDSRYLILKSAAPNSYSANILVKEKDALIDSLLNDPINFKDKKLNLKWVVKDNEAVYVPVSSKTSARGLNK